MRTRGLGGRFHCREGDRPVQRQSPSELGDFAGPGRGDEREPGSPIDLVISRGPKPPRRPPSEGENADQNQRTFKITVSVPPDAEGRRSQDRHD